MTVFPKRVWTKKGMVFNDKKPVRKLGDKVGVYDPNFTEVESGKVYPETERENVSESDELMYYDGLQPTDFGTFEDGFEATYTFKDYNGTVLKTGKVKDGETPVAPNNPTREHYTFQGWNPTVGPISKDTEFVAVYIPENYTVTIGVNDVSYGSVDTSEVTVAYETPISASGNILSIGENVEVTATAETGYVFSSWGELPATVTGNLTITATFEAEVSTYDLTIVAPEETEANAEMNVDQIPESFPYNMAFTGSVTVREWVNSGELDITSGGVTKHVIITPAVADPNVPSGGRRLRDWQFNNGASWTRIGNAGTSGEDPEQGSYYEITFDGDVSLRASYYYEPDPEPEPEPEEPEEEPGE